VNLVRTERRVVAFIGPPHSGKSTILYHIYSTLRRRHVRFFLQRACPDGEGIWTAETPGGRDIARQHKRAVSQFFSDFFVQFQVNSIKQLAKTFQLVLVDTGGKMSDQNRWILAVCSHYVLLVSSSYPASVRREWEEFAESCGLKKLAVFTTTPENLSEVAERILKLL